MQNLFRLKIDEFLSKMIFRLIFKIQNFLKKKEDDL